MTDLMSAGFLGEALHFAQKVHKRARQLKNRGDATAQDLEDAEVAIDRLRAIHRRHGIQPVDMDSRAEKRKRHDAP